MTQSTAPQVDVPTRTPVAIVTGASRGLGLALTEQLVGDGWHVVVDARKAAGLAAAVEHLGANVSILPGDVSDPAHRTALVRAAAARGGLDVLVNNASVLGPSPQPSLADYPLDVLAEVYAVNTVGPLGLVQQALPLLRQHQGRVVNISSDAAVEPYEGWGGYGSSKAALDQLTAILAAELPELGVYAFDPGDMRTDLHQLAFPGEDISDRPAPNTVVPQLIQLIVGNLPSGRYRSADLAATVTR